MEAITVRLPARERDMLDYLAGRIGKPPDVYAGEVLAKVMGTVFAEMKPQQAWAALRPGDHLPASPQSVRPGSRAAPDG